MASRATQAFKLGVISAGWLLAAGASAKDKPVVPGYMLRARTVAVLVDPGVSLEDPSANQTAQKDVETALLNWVALRRSWVRARQISSSSYIKATAKQVEETTDDPRQNNRAGAINTSQNKGSIGVQHGPQPPLATGPDPSGSQTGAGGLHPQLEVGGAQDSFLVYQGGVAAPLDWPPGWRWVSKDGLHAHNVPAVAEFRKAIAEAEKQAARQANKKP